MQYYPLLDRPRWGSTIQEQLLDLALQVADIPTEQLQELRPPLPQVVLFRPRMGYRSYQDRQAGIRDVIDVDRIYNDRRVSWTGTEGGYAGSTRNAMGDGY